MLLHFTFISFVSLTFSSNTKVSISGENFLINNEITYKNAKNNDVPGLLLNSRMIQGVFDDANESTIHYWLYPDTNKWDPVRNNDEFVNNISLWNSYGLLSFTVGLQGGGPVSGGYPNPQPWIVSAFDFNDGSLDNDFMNRLEKILEKGDSLSMAPIVQFFYSGQIERYNKDNKAINESINNIVDWLISKNYNNLLIDVANECTHGSFKGTILDCSSNMTKTISDMKSYIKSKTGKSNTEIGIFISSSTNNPPSNDMIGMSDFVLMHGNGKDPSDIKDMINTVRNSDSYKSNPKPIVFNEDPNTDFNDNTNNMQTAIDNHASWGFYEQGTNDYLDGYQSPPVDWLVDTSRKEAFFDQVQSYTAT